MPLIKCKIQLKLKWKNFCVLLAAGADNNDANINNIISTIKETTLYARDNQKLSKLLSKIFERLAYWNEYKTKSEDKDKANKYRYFLKSSFFGVNKLFVLVCANQDDHAKRFKTQRCYLPKGIIDNYNVIINEKKLL